MQRRPGFPLVRRFTVCATQKGKESNLMFVSRATFFYSLPMWTLGIMDPITLPCLPQQPLYIFLGLFPFFALLHTLIVFCPTVYSDLWNSILVYTSQQCSVVIITRLLYASVTGQSSSIKQRCSMISVLYIKELLCVLQELDKSLQRRTSFRARIDRKCTLYRIMCIHFIL